MQENFLFLLPYKDRILDVSFVENKQRNDVN